MRLGRLMCGKPLAFRAKFFFISFSRGGEAQPRHRERSYHNRHRKGRAFPHIGRQSLKYKVLDEFKPSFNFSGQQTGRGSLAASAYKPAGASPISL
jgi:hypothetical protein